MKQPGRIKEQYTYLEANKGRLKTSPQWPALNLKDYVLFTAKVHWDRLQPPHEP